MKHRRVKIRYQHEAFCVHIVIILLLQQLKTIIEIFTFHTTVSFHLIEIPPNDQTNNDATSKEIS